LAVSAALVGPAAGASGASSSSAARAADRTHAAVTPGVLTASPSAVVEGGRARVHLTVPGAGKITLKIIHRRRPIGRRTLTLPRGGAQAIGVVLSRSALRELRDGNVSTGLRVTFAAAHGPPFTRGFGLRLKHSPTR